METYILEILNPKGVRLLEDLADLEIITFKPQTAMARQVAMSDEEWNEAYQRIMQGGSNTLDVLEHLRESRQDRPMPFRDDE